MAKVALDKSEVRFFVSNWMRTWRVPLTISNRYVNSQRTKRTWLSDVYCGQVVPNNTRIRLAKVWKVITKINHALARPFPSFGVPLTANDTQ